MIQLLFHQAYTIRIPIRSVKEIFSGCLARYYSEKRKACNFIGIRTACTLHCFHNILIIVHSPINETVSHQWFLWKYSQLPVQLSQWFHLGYWLPHPESEDAPHPQESARWDEWSWNILHNPLFAVIWIACVATEGIAVVFSTTTFAPLLFVSFLTCSTDRIPADQLHYQHPAFNPNARRLRPFHSSIIACSPCRFAIRICSSPIIPPPITMTNIISHFDMGTIDTVNNICQWFCGMRFHHPVFP